MSSFRKPILITRVSPGEYVDGLWSEGLESTIQVTASIQPLTPIEMQELPELRRNKGAYKIYTSTKLRSVLEAQHNADKLTIDGIDYEIYAVSAYQSGVIEHYKALATRVEPS